MVDIPLRTKHSFLCVDYVKDGEIATIVKAPYIVKAEQSRFNKEQTVITIKLKRDGETYRLSLNDSSNDRLVKAFGHDGDLWVGKDILLQKRTLFIDGKQREAVFVTTVDAQEDDA